MPVHGKCYRWGRNVLQQKYLSSGNDNVKINGTNLSVPGAHFDNQLESPKLYTNVEEMMKQKKDQ